MRHLTACAQGPGRWGVFGSNDMRKQPIEAAGKRFQPIIVPTPSAIATATLTQSGMNFVAWVVAELGDVVGAEVARPITHEQPHRFRGEMHVVADLGDAIRRQSGDGAVVLELLADIAHQSRQRRIGPLVDAVSRHVKLDGRLARGRSFRSRSRPSKCCRPRRSERS